jgi:hypothetical protein
MPGEGSQACPKVPPGRLSLREERELKKVQRMLGQKGVTAQARSKKATRVSTSERENKNLVRLRDQFCRYPNCGCQRGEITGIDVLPEVAHTRDKGMGGDPLLEVSIPSLMILLCHYRHQGPRSLHSKHVRVEAMTPRGTDGPVAFFAVNLETGRETLIGITEPPTFEDEEV